MGGGYQSGAASQVDWRGQVVVSAKTTTGTAIRTNRATNQPSNQLYTLQIKSSPASWTFIKVHLNSFIWQKLCGIVMFVSTTFCHGFFSCVLCVCFWSLTPGSKSMRTIAETLLPTGQHCQGHVLHQQMRLLSKSLPGHKAPRGQQGFARPRLAACPPCYL